jgi:hypothetical protein
MQPKILHQKSVAVEGPRVPLMRTAMVFTVKDRDRLRRMLVSAAKADVRITGVALTGSAALGGEDRWSDIDLAFGIAADGPPGQVMEDWTRTMYDAQGAVHHVDTRAGPATYRTFLLANTLQVDLGFWPTEEFGATAPSFKLLSGKANNQPVPTDPSAAHLIGMAWLYALHARSSIERGRPWQAEYMISGMRDYVLSLACLRYGVATSQGRGVDQVPVEVTLPLKAALVRGLDRAELSRAFAVASDALLDEARHVDVELAQRLSGPIKVLSTGADGRLR